MGDFTFLVPPSSTANTPAAAPAAAPDTEPAGPAAAAPRCRRVHFVVPDLPSSSASARAWFAPSAATAEASAAAVAELEEDRMDLLWEDFNEELLAMRRAELGRGSPPWSDGDDSSTESSSAGRAHAAGAGCFPVLRSSARAAGGVVHYRRRAGTWVLLMKIFRRLFVIDKTIAALPRPPAAGGAAPPAARGAAAMHW